MNVNERIAIALGWYIGEYGHIRTPDGRYDVSIPDYEHSLDALMEPLSVLRERGWTWFVGACLYDERRDDYYAWCEFGDFFTGTFRMFEGFGATPSKALALAVAEALEASNGQDR